MTFSSGFSGTVFVRSNRILLGSSHVEGGRLYSAKVIDANRMVTATIIFAMKHFAKKRPDDDGGKYSV